MQWTYDDGGRAEAGYKGVTGDCVVRSVAIATEQSYQNVYDALGEGCRSQRTTKNSSKMVSARDGVYTKRKWFKDYMIRLGWEFIPTMGIGTGCRVHLTEGELPMGRLLVLVSKHYTAVVDGVIHDIYDPQRSTLVCENGVQRIAHRCVYGYWQKKVK